MNILLWCSQALLALLYLGGGYFKASEAEKLASQFSAIQSGGWRSKVAVGAP